MIQLQQSEKTSRYCESQNANDCHQNYELLINWAKRIVFWITKKLYNKQ